MLLRWDRRGLRILRKLRELQKIAIFVKFVAEQKIVQFVVVFNPGHGAFDDIM